jgi:hypothetical protein
MSEQLDLDFILGLIELAEIPKAEKAYLKAATETEGGIPDITGHRQHQAYGEFCKELRRGLPEHGTPGFSMAFLQWARSRDGIYATAFVTKMMEWERRRPVGTGRNVPGHEPR